MLPKWHILFGAGFSLILYLFFNINLFNSIIVFFASVFIDVDHYLFYIQKYKNWSLKKAYDWHKKLPKNHKPIMHLFHTIEFLTLILILSFVSNFFVFILSGMLFHSGFDIIDLSTRKDLSNREFSLIRYLLNKDKSRYF